MELQLSKSIRALRMQKGVTQEALAAHLGVSFQAVSKWETGTTAPDIALLPDIAVYFGVPIDALFALPEKARLSRIENMLKSARMLPHETYASEEEYLRGLLSQTPDNARACCLMASLYLHQARALRDQAVDYAQHAVKQEPGSKYFNSVLLEAMDGTPGDYYLTRRYPVAAFYRELTQAHPDCVQPHLRLLDQLLHDNRLDEAQAVLTHFRGIAPRHVRILFYEGDIAYGRGETGAAFALWKQAICDHDGPAATGWFLYAERMQRLCRYEEALEGYQKDFELSERPRFIDSLAAMAHIHELRGEYALAIEMYEEEKRIFQTEWGIVSGEVIDGLDREIARMKRLIGQVKHALGS